ncbi:hypothetical protein [Fusobacterium ulcerans]|nr:hypothetical protein [Fusobacterium ulcerans]
MVFSLFYHADNISRLFCFTPVLFFTAVYSEFKFNFSSIFFLISDAVTCDNFLFFLRYKISYSFNHNSFHSSQQKDCDPINKKIEDNITSLNITSRILKDTHTGGEGETDVDLKPKGEVKPKDKQQSNGESEEKLELSDNIPMEIQDILKKYNELKLPEYDYRPDNYILLGVCRELGAVKLFEALTLMSQSEFVKNNLSINTIFKIENLKKALNGNFKDRERKGCKKTESKKSFERPVYEDFTGELIDHILNETLGGE